MRARRLRRKSVAVVALVPPLLVLVISVTLIDRREDAPPASAI